MRLPIMPLNGVHYPWMPIVLSIFEERYVAMLADVLAGAHVFGTALIAEGREVGGPATPHPVGVEVMVARAWDLPDGSWRVVGVGRHRFSVDEMVAQEPYPVAEVRFEGLQEASNDVPEALISDLRGLFEEHLALLQTLLGTPSAGLGIPFEPARLSYMVAAHLGIDLLSRQRLLEIPGARGRLEVELELLKADLAKLRLFAAVTPSEPSRN